MIRTNYRSGPLTLPASDWHHVIGWCIADPHPSMGVVTASAHPTVTAFRPCPELRGDLGLMAAAVAPDEDDLMAIRWTDLHANQAWAASTCASIKHRQNRGTVHILCAHDTPLPGCGRALLAGNRVCLALRAELARAANSADSHRPCAQWCGHGPDDAIGLDSIQRFQLLPTDQRHRREAHDLVRLHGRR